MATKDSLSGPTSPDLGKEDDMLGEKATIPRDMSPSLSAIGTRTGTLRMDPAPEPATKSKPTPWYADRQVTKALSASYSRKTMKLENSESKVAAAPQPLTPVEQSRSDVLRRLGRFLVTPHPKLIPSSLAPWLGLTAFVGANVGFFCVASSPQPDKPGVEYVVETNTISQAPSPAQPSISTTISSEPSATASTPTFSSAQSTTSTTSRPKAPALRPPATAKPTVTVKPAPAPSPSSTSILPFGKDGE